MPPLLFYFIHEILGLCYVRVPVWVPFRLQIYFNGHNWLASLLSLNKIQYQMIMPLSTWRILKKHRQLLMRFPQTSFMRYSMILRAPIVPLWTVFSVNVPLEHYAGGIRN